jgi:AcrR family transcriptional regulator
MSSGTWRSHSPYDTDLTARARIRDAAIEQFGASGYAETTVRSIAESAGVSPALVIHHFGSKDGLRHACDEYIVEEIIEGGSRALGAELLATMREWLERPEQFRPHFDYVARMLGERSELGARLFASLVARTRTMLAAAVDRGEVRSSADPEMQALIVALHGLAPLVLQHQIGALLDEAGLGRAVLQRMTVPTLELYTHGLYTSSSYLEAASSMMGDRT